MENSILTKLREELELDLSREAQVLYILAEVRKVIEHRKDKGLRDHSELKFYCNWVLHIRIDRDDKNVTTIFDGVDILEGVSFEDYVHSAFFNRISNFQLLRSALVQFLDEHKLPTKICDREGNWNAFLFLLCGIVSEVPLMYRGQATSPDMIKELTLTREEGEFNKEFRLHWSATLFNGETHGVVTDCPQPDVEYDWWSGKPLDWHYGSSNS
jgi:hypothetical protein